MGHRVGTSLLRAFIGLLFGITVSPGFADAQTANPYIADQPNTIQQVSLIKSSDPLPGPAQQSATKQFRVSIRYLLVDDETRREIYASLDPELIRHASVAPEDEPKSELLADSGSQSCSKQLSSHGHSATCILDTVTANKIVKLATDSPICTVSQAPGVILQQNRAAEINDMVQRPMLIDVDRDTEQLKPVIRIFDEGTHIRILARLAGQASGGDSIELTTEFSDTRILAVNTVEILGLQETPTTLQDPVSESTTVVSSERLTSDQLVLIDPHIKKSATIEVDSTSMLGRLPVVGKAFAETESKQVENNLIVLIKPAIYSP